MRNLSVALLLSSFLFTGCATVTSYQKRDTFNDSGHRHIAQVLENIISGGKNIFLAISLEADSEEEFYTLNKDDITRSQYLGIVSKYRAYFGGNKHFEIVDTKGIDEFERANYMLAEHQYGVEHGVNYSGKLIDLSTKKTIAEYSCTFFYNTQKSTCSY